MQCAIEVEKEESVQPEIEQWEHHSLQTRHKLRIPAKATPWSDETCRSILATMTPREIDAIDVAVCARMKALRGRRSDDFFIDISQGVQSQKWGELGTCCTSAKVWDLARNRCLNPGHHLATLGYPVAEKLDFYKDPICHHYLVGPLLVL